MRPIKIQKVIRAYLRMARNEYEILRYGSEWAYIKEQVLQRDGYKCVICGNSNKMLLQVNHIKPKAHGGTNEMSNLVTLCVFCHAKYHRTVTPELNTQMLQMQAEYLSKVYVRAAQRSEQAWRERYG
jgi:predicted restriction endonuclease